jgi:hypothetical protein
MSLYTSVPHLNGLTEFTSSTELLILQGVRPPPTLVGVGVLLVHAMAPSSFPVKGRE